MYRLDFVLMSYKHDLLIQSNPLSDSGSIESQTVLNGLRTNTSLFQRGALHLGMKPPLRRLYTRRHGIATLVFKFIHDGWKLLQRLTQAQWLQSSPGALGAHGTAEYPPQSWLSGSSRSVCMLPAISSAA